MIVPDASVAAKWFIDEPGSEAARRVLLELQERPSDFAVPELFFVEMLSVLSRTGASSDELKTYLAALEELGMHRVGQGRELLQRAAEVVRAFGLSAYDAVYAATADLLGGTWVTADEKAHRKISSLNRSRVLS